LHVGNKYDTIHLGNEEMLLFEIVFYINSRDEEPVRDFIAGLALKNDKHNRMNFNKISDYLKVLAAQGTTAGQPYIKHLDGDIWELRPIDNRIMFAAFDGNRFILLHHFLKQTQKTPGKEIDTAKRRLEEARKERHRYER
jgi:phage-related protein